MRLSLLERAERDPSRLALILGGERIRWGDLRDELRDAHARALELRSSEGATLDVLVPELDRRTFVRLAARIELGIPFLALHPRLSEAERERLRRRYAGSSKASGLSSSAPAAAGGDERTLAALMTSGTSGAPRAVLLSRRAFEAAAEASARHLGWLPEDRWLLCMPPAHVGGLSILIRCWLADRPVVIGSSFFDPEAIVWSLIRDEVSLASMVPTMLHALLEVLERTSLSAPPRLRALLLGGAPARAELLARASALGLPVLPTYGLTEACAQVVTAPLDRPLDPGGAIGPVLGSTELRVRQGEIQLRGPTLMSGYHPADRAEPPLTADGWLRTRDAGALGPGGWLRVQGRLDAMILTGGENVHPSVVEAALCAHPAIDEALVFGEPDPRWGERVVAALSPSGPTEPSLEELRPHLEAHLATHQRPRRLVWLERLPRGPSGKL
ncbi:MAG: fatty acid--CoA ligase family protein, partial [Myxococcales bacterium]|nr:fatty acid--CoA ligase family protein [Myxococcales bacterium]